MQKPLNYQNNNINLLTKVVYFICIHPKSVRDLGILLPYHVINRTEKPFNPTPQEKMTNKAMPRKAKSISLLECFFCYKHYILFGSYEKPIQIQNRIDFFNGFLFVYFLGLFYKLKVFNYNKKI